MSSEAAIFKILTSDYAVAAAVGARIYPGDGTALPQVPTYPAVSFHITSATANPTLSGASTIDSDGFQVDVWASSYLSASAVGETIRRALEAYRGTIAGEDIQQIRFLNKMDLAEDNPNEPRIWRRSLDFDVTYTRLNTP